ncbi:MAG: 30S ribosome-binding factor RbfA [Kiritimatiellae bacterium]|nr:30S ribosome-binding factor RbfA [Kiritimatiellia bacterium]
MAVDRLERINSLLRREIAEALPRIFLSDERIDASCVTILDVSTAPNLRNATVTVSIFNHPEEHSVYLHRLVKAAPELQRLINRDCKMKFTPKLRFVITDSLEKGDHVLDVLNHLDIPE